MTSANRELYVGCLAVIIGSRTEYGAANIGKIVTCEVRVCAGDKVVYGGVTHTTYSDPAWIVSGDIQGQTDRGQQYKGRAYYAEKHLMPLPPLEDPEAQDMNVYDKKEIA